MIGVILWRISFQNYLQHYSGTTRTMYSTIVAVHQQVCCDKISLIAVNLLHWQRFGCMFTMLFKSVNQKWTEMTFFYSMRVIYICQVLVMGFVSWSPSVSKLLVILLRNHKNSTKLLCLWVHWQFCSDKIPLIVKSHNINRKSHSSRLATASFVLS